MIESGFPAKKSHSGRKDRTRHNHEERPGEIQLNEKAARRRLHSHEKRKGLKRLRRILPRCGTTVPKRVASDTLTEKKRTPNSPT